MRKLLDTVYRISGGLAAVSLLGITVIVFGQVLLNLIDYVAMSVFGRSYSLLIPSYALLSGMRWLSPPSCLWGWVFAGRPTSG